MRPPPPAVVFICEYVETLDFIISARFHGGRTADDLK